MLRQPPTEREVAGEEAHQQRAGHVLEQRGERKRKAEQARRGEIDAVPQGGPDPAAGKDDEDGHLCPVYSVIPGTRRGWARNPQLWLHSMDFGLAAARCPRMTARVIPGIVN